MDDILTGLTQAQVEQSRREHGANVFTTPPGESLLRRFLRGFRDPLIIILMVAGVLSVGISLYEYFALGEGLGVFFEPVGIFVAIFLATGLSFFFELRADREFAVLNRVSDDESVTVIRDSRPLRVPRRDIVVGDIVILETGQEVPADGQLLESVAISVDESSLTGEPLCHKSADPADRDPDATFPTDHVLRGTKIMEGHGTMTVTAVGDSTENGKVYTATRIDDSVKTPLDEQFERLGILISRASYIIGAAVVVGRLIMYFVNIPFDWISFLAYLLQTIMIAVTLVVVSVPEGLPMAVSLSLAYSMRRMLRTNNLVRRMHACETMGAATVICTDKTGTLTRNRMQVVAADCFLPDADRPHLYAGMAVNATARLDLGGDTPQVLGNPTEGAILLWLHDNGTDYRSLRDSVTLVDEIPFSTERKYMATVVRDNHGRHILYVKGAPEIVFDMCHTSAITRVDLDARLAAYQDRGMRTLAFAYAVLDPGQRAIADGTILAPDLHLAAIVAIADPVRDDVPDAVRTVTDAGIHVKIVTGDTPRTAREIGRRIGLWDDTADTDTNIITGAEIAAMDDAQLRRRVGDLKIIARARPMDKKRLVAALQANGHVVAVTGDGTNDAPALKAAHVGLSMGDGTAVAKEASDITIIDNSFASIGRAVMWGRSLYRNIQRFILFQLTVNVAACLVVLCGSFMGVRPPLTVTQMLWVNLIMDTFAAIALASLPPSPAVMHDPPRSRTDFIITAAMWRFIVGYGITFAAIILAFMHVINTGGRIPCLDVAPDRLPTVLFTTFVLMQFWNIFNARAFATGRSAMHLRGCNGFLAIAATILFGQIAIVRFGGPLFSVTPLDARTWLILLAATSPVLLIPETLRLLRH